MEATAQMTSACESAAGATRHPAARIGQMLFWLCVVAMVLARIWLVSDEDIIASETPHDALWTVKVADRGYWGEAEHDHLTLIRPPAYPLWLSAVRFLGIPQRTGIELAYIGAAALLAYAICAAGAFRWMALLAFALILSSPYPLTIFRWTLTDALNAPLMMVLAALLVLAICAYSWRGRWMYGLLAGAAAGAFSLNRGEGQMMALVAIALTAVLALLSAWRQGWRVRVGRFAFYLLVPAVVCLAMVTAVKWKNHVRYGLWATDELKGPGWKAANKALLRIKPDQPIDYVSLTQSSISAAGRVSPTFAQIVPLLQGPTGNFWHRAGGVKRDLPEGELLTGFHGWALRDAAYRTRKFSSSAQCDAYWAQVAEELNAAFAAGELPERRVLSAYLDPDIGTWIRRVPESARKMWSFTIGKPVPPIALTGDPHTASQPARDVYNRVALRRATLADKPQGRASGWIRSKANVVRLELWGEDGLLYGVCERFASPTPTGERRFTLYSKGIQEGSRVKWRIIREGAVPVTIEAEFGETGKIRTYRPTQGGAAMCIDVAVPDPNHPSLVPAMARAWLCRRQGYAVEYLIYAAIAALVMIAIRARHLPAAAWIAIALLVAMALSRFVLFTLIDASAWHGNQPRYVFPAVPVLLAGCVLIVSLALSQIGVLLGAMRASRQVSK